MKKQRQTPTGNHLTLVASGGRPTHETDPSTQSAAPRLTALQRGKAALRVVREATVGAIENNVVGSVSYMRDVSAELFAAHAKLDPKKPRTVMNVSPLVVGPRFDNGRGGELSSELSVLIMAGDSCFGVVNTYDHDDELGLPLTSVVLLPTGHGAGNQLPSGISQPAGVVKEVDFYDAEGPQVYVIDRWDTLNGNDGTVSLEGEQCTLTLMPESVEIAAGESSTNPTFVLDTATYQRMIQQARTDHSPHTKFNDLMFYLQNNPHVWDPNYIPRDLD